MLLARNIIPVLLPACGRREVEQGSDDSESVVQRTVGRRRSGARSLRPHQQGVASFRRHQQPHLGHRRPGLRRRTEEKQQSRTAPGTTLYTPDAVSANFSD